MVSVPKQRVQRVSDSPRKFMYCWADDVASLFKTKKVRVRFNVAFRLDNVVIAVIAPTSKRDSARISKKTSPYTIRMYVLRVPIFSKVEN